MLRPQPLQPADDLVRHRSGVGGTGPRHDEGAHARGDAVLDDAEHAVGSHLHQSEIDRLVEIGQLWDRRDARDLAVRRRDRDQPTAVPPGQAVLERDAPDEPGGRRPDDGERPGSVGHVGKHVSTIGAQDVRTGRRSVGIDE